MSRLPPATFPRLAWALTAAAVVGFPPLVSSAHAAEVYVPQPLADRIRSFESTRLDIGEGRLVFDADPRTLIRTPALNPAFVRVEFNAPVTFEFVRVIFSNNEHEWSLAVADSLADLTSQSGTYRVVVAAGRTPATGTAAEKLPTPVTARAVQLDVRRLTGDDYVHICELQLCQPGRVERVRIQEVIDRRQADAPAGRRDVTGPITRLVDSVVWLKAAVVAGGVQLPADDEVRWEPQGDGLVPFGTERGMFLIRAPGEHRLVARGGDFEPVLTVVGEPRAIRNRRPDVEIFFIERLPRLDYPPADSRDPRAGWPAEGSPVTWRAHLYNWGERPVRVRYEWQLDGRSVDRGEMELPVGPPGPDGVPLDLDWRWEFARHDLTLTLTPVEPLAEVSTLNNTLTIQTNAITVGLWVERSLWDFHHEHQHRLPPQDANSFAGWAQRLIRRWNLMFAEAIYPNEYPQGITERVRLDRLVVVPDFALPLAGGLPSNNPDNRDRTVDMVWGLEAGDVRPDSTLKPDHWWSPERAIEALADGRIAAGQIDPPFWCGYGYIHEMGHARYLVDAYGFNVHSGLGDELTRRKIRVTDEQGPILGRYMPQTDDIQHWQKYPGNMAGSEWYYSVYEAMCWNRVSGWRARGGNCNSPPTIGEFLQDIPTRLIFEFTGDDGRPLAGAVVYAYRARGTGKDWYAKVYEDPPDVQATADDRGRVTFDRTLWAADGRIVHTFGHSNGVVLLRVTYGGQHYFLFEEVTDANLAYNLGHRDEYVFARRLELRTGPPRPEEWRADRRWDAPGTGFGRR